MLLNAAKCQLQLSTVSELLKENQQGVKLPPSPRVELSYKIIQLQKIIYVYICICIYICTYIYIYIHMYIYSWGVYILKCHNWT